MPMKMPIGPAWLRSINWNIPNLLQAGIPGYEFLVTRLMKTTIQNAGVADISELRALSLEAGVKMIARQMAVDLFGCNRDDFILEVTDYVGTASFLPITQQANVSLFI